MARIDQNTVDRIVDAARIEDVVRSYGVDLHKAGTVLKGLCPFHDEKTPSFVVSPAKGIFKCFGCGKGGHAAKFVMEKEQCSYPDALRRLARMYNIEVPERELTPEELRREMERQNLLEINEWYATQCAEWLRCDPMGRGVGLSYFRERRFSDESVERFRLGYALDQNVAIEAARSAGFSDDIVLKSGIGGEVDGRKFDRFRGRVMFPIVNVAGKVVAFGGRVLGSLSEEDKRRGKGKYVNSPEVVGVYEKNRELYGLFQAKSEIQKRGFCILVEGYADVISMHQAGMRNTVAACGTAFTERQMESVRRFTNSLVVMDDGDSAGIAAAQKAANVALRAGMTVKLVLLPEGQDPDDFARSHSAEEIEEYIECSGMNFVEFKRRVLTGGHESDPDVVQRALDSVIETIVLLPSAISRELYVKETASRFEMSREAIEEQIRIRMGEIERQERREEVSRQRREEERRAEEESKRVVYKFAIQEREVIQFLVRHCGETIDVPNGEGVGRYMANDVLLASLEVWEGEGRPRMQNPAFEKFVRCVEENDVSDDKFFTFNEDDDIRATATALLLDREVASRRFDSDLAFNVREDDPAYERKRAEFDERVRQERELRMKMDIETIAKEYKRAVVSDRMAETRRQIVEHPESAMEGMVKMQEFTRMMQALK